MAGYDAGLVFLFDLVRSKGFVGRERLLVAAGLEFIPLYRHYEKTPPVLLIRHQSLFVMNKSRIAHV